MSVTACAVDVTPSKELNVSEPGETEKTGCSVSEAAKASEVLPDFSEV